MSVNNENRIRLSLNSLREKFILVSLVYLVIIFMSVCLINYVNSSLSHYQLTITFVLSLIIVLTVILCIRYFVNQIYKPIMTIDSAVKILESGDVERFLNYDVNMEESSNTDIIIKTVRRLKSIVNRQYSAEILKRQAEVSALQSQINPHFLYNTLESIRGQALEKGMEEIALMTEALSTYFRYSISKKGDIVTLEDEITNLENYFVIQQYRFDNKFILSVNYDEADHEILNYMIPKLTMQPIVENSIYHGLEPKIGEGNISIRITCTERRLIINVSDDGIGMEKAVLETLNEAMHNYKHDSELQRQQSEQHRHTGIALVNVNMRIKLLFGEQYGINVSSTKGFGTDVEIILPLVKSDETESIVNTRKAHEN